MKNDTAALKNSLAVSYKAIQSLTIRFSNGTPGYVIKRHKNRCMNVYNSLFTFPKTESNQDALQKKNGQANCATSL